ncbi:MAG: preprotein translocase subunit YajC [Clostridia bacterium]|nr:preprotein translocase subunit YajC [Clostridia bacterium]
MDQRMISTIVWFAVIILFFYFVVLRPQKKQQKQLKTMLDNLAVGDKVVTIGGIHGKVASIKDDTVVLETGSGNNKATITFTKNAIASCLTIKE